MDRGVRWVAALAAGGLVMAGTVTSGAAWAADPTGPEPSVASTDVSATDTNLGSVAGEVVVVTSTDDGPVVTKLRADDPDEAARLAAELDAEPGVAAEVNQTVTIGDPPPTPKGGKSGEAVGDHSGTDSVDSVGAINSEPLGIYQWGLRWVGAEDAWDVTRAPGITIAVVDSGVDVLHPDLVNQTLPQINLVNDGVTGDPANHGTRVSGIVAAAFDGAGIAGLANQVKVLPVRVCDATSVCDKYTVAQGIIAAVDAGANVINLSLGGPSYSTTEAAAVQYAVDRSVTVVASAGNAYQQGNPVWYPAAYAGVIGVSSINEQGNSSAFANTGYYVDLSAPGEDILSTTSGGSWDYGDGTSFAAPFVSAGAALVRAANPTLTSAQVENVMFTTAQDDGSGDGWDTWFGYGLLRADLAARAAALMPGGVLAPKAPAAPAAPSAVAGNASAGLSWSAPPSDGGAAVDGYEVVASPGGASCATAGLACTVGGLANGAAYGFAVRAHNAVGWSDYSAQSTPVVPGPPTAVKVKAKSGRSKLYVDVNPNKGKGYWTFTVQKQNPDTSWQSMKSYRTKGSKETRTVNLRKGNYRVVVAPKYGYLGVTSGEVRLKR